MKFGPVGIDEAEGAILAHSIKLPTTRLKKGKALSAGDVDALRAAGMQDVIVAQPGDDDVLEDEAARQIAEALVPDPANRGVWLSAPFTGRANLYAETGGILRIDAAAVSALNRVHEAVTFASLEDFSRVSARQMIGTVKIIPYGAPGPAVREACSMLAGQNVVSVHPVTAKTATLVLTRTPGMKEKVLNKGGDAVRARLTALGIDQITEHIVPHETAPLADALAKARTDLTLILTGSATSDRGDVGPAALLASGGTLTRFGMPVDPGNLLFLGARAGRPVIGLPGCARSPKLNGADWVIERLSCGLPVSDADISAMGVGGLLKEIPSRPEPRGGGARAPRRPVIGAVLLAAGGSTRMRGADKLLEPVTGGPLLRRVADALTNSAVDTVVCVQRPDDDARRSVLDPDAVRIVANPRAAEGMATSITAGIEALGHETDAALIVMGDMPEITSDDINRLVAAFDPEEDRAIVRAVTSDGRAGHPVLFGRRFFEALTTLSGDRGAKSVVAEHPDYVVDVPLSGESAVIDLDTPEAWAAWRANA